MKPRPPFHWFLLTLNIFFSISASDSWRWNTSFTFFLSLELEEEFVRTFVHFTLVRTLVNFVIQLVNLLRKKKSSIPPLYHESHGGQWPEGKGCHHHCASCQLDCRQCSTLKWSTIGRPHSPTCRKCYFWYGEKKNMGRGCCGSRLG